ncbi:2-hydroxyacyl-CoA dehydratase [candidate division FCPU426 bacterium]|nr:2-hydroxyacyl-CoA dehydratase [candidate division FCPU426 bacterium]
MKTDFEKRYQRAPLHRPAEKVSARVRAASEDLAARLHKQPDRLVSLPYYEELFTTEKRKKELQILNRKVVGTYCYFAPEELIYASGDVPIRLCSGHSDTITTAEELLPRDICPLVKSSFGFPILGDGWIDACDVIALPTSCDAKTKLGEYLADYLPVWMINLPKIKNYDGLKEYWLKEIKLFLHKLEELNGKKVKAPELKNALQLLKRRAELYRAMYELRLAHPLLLSHQDLLMVVQSSFYDDLPRWINQTELLYNEMKKASATGKYAAKGKRLMITGAPIIWPNFKILNIITELGSTVVADDMCAGHQRLWDYAEPDEWTLEGMLEAVAARYIFPSVCPCFTTSYDRIDKILHLAREAKVDGVIYHDLRLCQIFDMEKDLVVKVLKENQIPVITLHTDYGQEDVEQLRTRIEAFLEMIL